MKREILSYEEKRRNERLKELHSQKIKNLLTSGTTGQLVSWEVEDILSDCKGISDKDRIGEYEWENTISRSGLTYLEIEQFNNTYNNFK